MTISAGTLYSAANLAVTAEETKAAQWRQALQTVNFNESGLIPTAFLMQSFEDDSRYGNSARQIEQTVLEQTNQPQTFDLVFGNMLANMQTAEQVHAVIDVGHQIDSRLYSLWWEASQQSRRAASRSHSSTSCRSRIGFTRPTRSRRN